MLLPKQFAEKAGAKIMSQFVWETTGYAFGVDGKGKPERTKQAHEEFVAFNRSLLESVESVTVKAFFAFLNVWSPEMFASFPQHEEALDQNFVFRLEGERRFLHEVPEVQESWLSFYRQQKGKTGQCLISGELEQEIPSTHPQLKGVKDAQSSGAAIVSFNDTAYESFGKKQNLNSPVGKRSAFAYTTALNYLLDRSNRRKIQIGDATTVFWAEQATPAEEDLFQLLDPGFVQNEDLSEADKANLEERIHGLLTAISLGRPPKSWEDSDCRFFILGLSPNAARISVRFFHDSTVAKLAETIGLHYQQMKVVRQFDREPAFPSPRQILKKLAIREDMKLLSPILSGQLMQAILTGARYPQALFSSVMGRVRAERHIDRIRAGLIKAILMRNHQQEITEMLDLDNRQIGYVLGRLFAVLEKLQDEAVPGTNATIRDRFFSSASSTPQRAFHMLIKNAQNHLAKLRKDPVYTGLSVVRDKMITDLVALVPAYPASMTIEDQGLFTLGYYHQKKDLFTKKAEK